MPQMDVQAGCSQIYMLEDSSMLVLAVFPVLGRMTSTARSYLLSKERALPHLLYLAKPSLWISQLLCGDSIDH